jgi:hypothetical protein
LVLPNVPKGSRGQSAPGIDVLAVLLNQSDTSELLGDGEWLYLMSAKHTTEDVGDLRRKLVHSVSKEELTVTYLGSQLRVLAGRLAERGYDTKRIRLFLRSSPLLDPKHVRILAVGAVDAGEEERFVEQMKLLPPSESRLRHFRRVLVPELHTLHERV